MGIRYFAQAYRRGRPRSAACEEAMSRGRGGRQPPAGAHPAGQRCAALHAIPRRTKPSRRGAAQAPISSRPRHSTGAGRRPHRAGRPCPPGSSSSWPEPGAVGPCPPAVQLQAPAALPSEALVLSKSWIRHWPPPLLYATCSVLASSVPSPAPSTHQVFVFGSDQIMSASAVDEMELDGGERHRDKERRERHRREENWRRITMVVEEGTGRETGIRIASTGTGIRNQSVTMAVNGARIGSVNQIGSVTRTVAETGIRKQSAIRKGSRGTGIRRGAATETRTRIGQRGRIGSTRSHRGRVVEKMMQIHPRVTRGIRSRELMPQGMLSSPQQMSSESALQGQRRKD